MKPVSYKDGLLKRLSDPEYAAGYLTESLEQGEAEFLLNLGEHGDKTCLPCGCITFVVESDHGTTSELRPPHDRGGRVGEEHKPPREVRDVKRCWMLGQRNNKGRSSGTCQRPSA